MLFLSFISGLLRAVFNVIFWAMGARVILSWFIPDDDSPLLLFLAYVTEPVIYPVRYLCWRLNLFEDSPLDVPFFIASVIVLILTEVL